MRHVLAAVVLGVCASTASADLLGRFEAAETAIKDRVAEFYGTAPSRWTHEDRVGKACLLNAMIAEFGGRKTEGYVAHLEFVAARRLSYGSAMDLSSDWMSAASRNRIWLDDIAPLAQACNSSF